MAAPVFEEFDPASDCDCPGCVHWRRVPPAARTGRHPAAHRAVILATAASTALVAGHTAPALAAPHAPGGPGVAAAGEPVTPQGGEALLPGPAGKRDKPQLRTPATTRAEIMGRARQWVAAKVPYNMYASWNDGYRQDCSGFVSMAWNLPGNEWTGSLDQYGVRIAKDDLQRGDILLFHNPDDPGRGSHVVIFGGWADPRHAYYIAYEETRPHARRQVTPYAYWTHSDEYVAYRYKGLESATAGTTPATPAASAPPVGTEPDTAKSGASAPDATPYPGRAYFGPGANNKYVTQLGRMLVERGAGRYYTSGPGPRWSEADRRATRAFQEAQGRRGRRADGLPGPLTWELLVTGAGRDIAGGAAGAPALSSRGVPGYPGRAVFRPGADNEYVTRLRKQLLKKGFGKYDTTAPEPRWGEADRRAVEDFQRAQGWRGGKADGYPGPETWRRLFS